MFFIALLSTSDSHAESTDISSITQTVRRLILMAFAFVYVCFSLELIVE